VLALLAKISRSLHISDCEGETMKRSNRKPLPVPDELQHLIEKREAVDRRTPKAKRSGAQPVERRTGKDRRTRG
jgi:hypothetical protein